MPPYPLAKERGMLSWGLGGSGTGVPFHTHGAVFAEGEFLYSFTTQFKCKVLHGMKRWFLYAPGEVLHQQQRSIDCV